MNLTNQTNVLPYFVIPGMNLKVLIDTGSTRSFINPIKAKKLFNKLIRKDPFEVRTAHGKSEENYSITIPAFSIFKSNQEIKLYVFNFHDYFDCLIGVDVIEGLGIKINLKERILETKSEKIKLEVYNTETELHKVEVFPECEQVIELRVKNIQNGEVLIPEKKLGGCTIQEGVATVVNGKTYCTIHNPTSQQFTLTTRPIVMEEFTEHYTTSSNLNHMTTNPHFSFDLIRTEHLNEEEKRLLENILEKYKDIFHIDGNNLSFTNEIKHVIHTHDEVPVYTKPYRYPQIHRDEVRTQINKMLEQGIIRPSYSPWSSPIWIVPKKLDASGKKKWRIVIDYRKLNDKTTDDRYPLPNITDLLDKLGRCQYFTTLDLASGFYQIEMDKDSIPKTAFNTENGHYEYIRMPMGLKNSPSTFQRVMDNILRGLINECCLVYLDDIIIFGSSLQQHLDNVRKVFERIRQSNLKIQLDKSEFLRKEVEYLGHIVTTEGVKPNPAKIQAIKSYPIPKTTKQIKGFLGLLGYYRKFIRDFARITKPMTKCLKKDAIIDTENLEYKECFERCKNLLIEEPVLQYPDFTQSFNLTTDASNVAIGAVLSQGIIGKDKPVAFASRTLNEHEKNYSTTEKELLAIIWATKHFRPYLYGRRFKIITDHKPLQWLFSIKDPSSKLVRWRLQLEEHEYDIVYKKGKQNTNADTLSRIELHAKETSAIQKFIQQTKEKTNGTRRNDIDNSSTAAQVDIDENQDNLEDLDTLIDQRYAELTEDFNEAGAAKDFYNDFAREMEVEINEIMETSADIQPQPNLENESEEINTIHSSDENPLIGIPISEKTLNVSRNQITMKITSITPKPTKLIILHRDKRRIIAEIPADDTEEYLKEFVDRWIAPEVKYSIYFETPSLYETLSRVLQTHFKNSKLDLVKTNKMLLDITRESQKLEIVKEHHEGLTNHRGIQETYSELKEIYYWPDMVGSIQKYINTCEECQTTKYDRKPLKPFLNKTPTATKPFEIVHMDTISIEKTKFLTIVDSFSKFAQAFPLPSAQAIDITEKLLDSFSHHGLPTLIITDNGTEFKNNTVQELLSFHKIKTHFTSSQHPDSNGIVERFHSTLIEHVRVFNNREEFRSEPIFIKVRYAVLAYNHSIHSVTKLRPMQIITGHFEACEPIIMDLEQRLASNYLNSHKEKMKLLHQIIQDRIEDNKQKVIEKHNKKREPLPTTIPDKVYVANKQKQSKTRSKYKQEEIAEINRDLKTANIVKTHHNTSERIHLSNIKRPVKHVSESPSPGTSQMGRK